MWIYHSFKKRKEKEDAKSKSGGVVLEDGKVEDIQIRDQSAIPLKFICLEKSAVGMKMSID